MKTVLCDIETAALSESELIPFSPEFKAPSNFRDPQKIAEAVAEKRKTWIEECALDALTARVLAIGLLIDDQFICISDPAPEALMLQEFWSAIQGKGGELHRLVGFNLLQFDVPFLIRRSYKWNVPVPLGIRRGRYWGDQIIDLRDLWTLGDRQARGSLDTIAKHMGVGAKTGEGADFGRLWIGDRAKAEAYLRNDLVLCQKIAQRLGVI